LVKGRGKRGEKSEKLLKGKAPKRLSGKRIDKKGGAILLKGP